jgi:pimeloyl-ACP methyl ester carboxylesterase
MQLGNKTLSVIAIIALYCRKKSTQFLIFTVILAIAIFLTCQGNEIRRETLINQWTCPTSDFESLFDTPKFSRSHYSITEHSVETSDGYLLKIFQVRLTQNQLEKLPVKLQQNQDRQILIQHAWVDSGDSFFISDNSIGFYLVHQGFDVWVGNNRGNKYSRRVISEIAQTLTNEKFFDFSFQEMGIYDQVACYKYILGLYGPTHRFTDKKRKITYLGLSQGTAQMFAGLLEEQTSDFLTENTEKFIAIGPIVFMGHAQTGVLKIFGKLVGSRLINSNVS